MARHIGRLLVGAFLLSAGCVAAQPPPPPYYWAEPPTVVEVEPGVAVVPEWHSEVFYSDGWYWTRYDGRWYQGTGRRYGWHVVAVQYVPPRVVGVPPGRYVEWRPPPPAPYQGGAVVYPVAPVAHSVAPAGHPVTPVAPVGHPVTPVAPAGHSVTPVAPVAHPVAPAAKPAAPAKRPAPPPAGHTVTPVQEH